MAGARITRYWGDAKFSRFRVSAICGYCNEITTAVCVWTPATVAMIGRSPAPKPAGIVMLIW